MAGLCWIAVTLVWFLSAGNSLAVEDQKKFAGIVQEVLRRYKDVVINKVRYEIKGQFSFAVNIPVDLDLNKLEKVFESDPPEAVIVKVSNGDVYQGTNVVAAKFQKFEKYTDHAEARVLDKIKPLADNSQGHFLVFYSYLSPCGAKCTNKNNRNNILDKINNIISKWKDYAFVFSTVFDKTSSGTVITSSELVKALKQLGQSKIGYNNIFRCYKPKNSKFHCIKCFSDGKLSEECVKNET